MNGVIVLGAEIVFNAQEPKVLSTSIDWDSLKHLGAPCAIALRVAPHLKPDSNSIGVIVGAAKSLCDQAKAHGVELVEFQLDFDCPQKQLPSYRAWLPQVRELVHPVRFAITTLPAWLDEPEFDRLIREADSYVLQVHSVPTSSASTNAVLCDTHLARQWIAKAATHGRPFAVALPTYRCSAGYAPSGKLLSVAMDSIQPVWPPDTHILELETDADAMSELVDELIKNRPQNLNELLWYRLPIATDTRNWRWPTLAAVMSGRKPSHKLEVLQEGEDPVDFSIANHGEAEEPLDTTVIVSWDSESATVADALAGWTVDPQKRRAVFRRSEAFRLRLAPGGKSKIGWLRFTRPTNVRVVIGKAA
jgi:hypothetical protein